MTDYRKLVRRFPGDDDASFEARAARAGDLGIEDMEDGDLTPAGLKAKAEAVREIGGDFWDEYRGMHPGLRERARHESRAKRELEGLLGESALVWTEMLTKAWAEGKRFLMLPQRGAAELLATREEALRLGKNFESVAIPYAVFSVRELVGATHQAAYNQPMTARGSPQ